MIKAVIFDVDGVLVDSAESVIAFYRGLMAKAGYPVPSREAIMQHFHLTLQQNIERFTGSQDKDELQRVWKLALDPSVRTAHLLTFPDTLESTLEHLHKKYKLAVVTSRVKFGVEEVFSASEIGHLFDVVVTYEDYTNPKPHPEPLLVALKRLGLKATEAIYIGDSKTDIEAAKAAGMKSIFINREPHDDATVNITEFAHLIRAIESIG